MIPIEHWLFLRKMIEKDLKRQWMKEMHEMKKIMHFGEKNMKKLKKEMKMDIFALVTFAITILGAIYYTHREVMTDIRCAREENRVQAARSDRLYEMFIDLLKENRRNG